MKVYVVLKESDPYSWPGVETIEKIFKQEKDAENFIADKKFCSIEEHEVVE